MATHHCSLSDLQKQILEKEKAKWLLTPEQRRKKPEEEKIAKSNDYIFDKKTFSIIKKKQVEQLDIFASSPGGSSFEQPDE